MLLVIILVLFLGCITVLGYQKIINGKFQESAIKAITVDSKNYNLRSSESRLIFVTAQYVDGRQINVNDLSTFSSTSSNVVMVDENGVVTAKENGEANIKITYAGLSETINVSVTSQLHQVNVKDFGAFGDAFHDDTLSFQNAIDYLAKKGGGDVYIPSGTYMLQPIFLKSNVNLVGENRDNVILKLSDHASNGQTRLIEMNNNTKVQSLTCDGNYQNHPNGSEHMHCIFVYDKDHILIENNRLINAVGDGISISGSRGSSNYVVIENNIVEENQRSQIVIEQVNHLRIFNNKISSKTGRPGIHFEPWEEIHYYDAKIIGNIVETNTEGYSILLTGADSEGSGVESLGYYFHGIEFSNNRVISPSGYVRIVDTSGLKVADNTFDVKYLHLWRKNEKVSISNNFITAEDGVRVEGGANGKLVSSDTSISKNTFHTSKKGIVIQDGTENIKITNNRFLGSGDQTGIELFVTEDISNVIVSKNSFRKYKYGIYFDYISHENKSIRDVSLLENEFIHLSEYATFMMGPVHNVVIDKNKVIQSSGVYISTHEGHSMSNLRISNNVIAGGKRGIYQTEVGKGSLVGLIINGNTILDSTAKGEGEYSTGAAIELNRFANPPVDVLIKNNTLLNNDRNFITVPESLLDSVVENNFKKSENSLGG
ncbi:right-handed parallel beta-helix repeat-containing protein [Robertmurraya korlensis]|uniref:right-handed parallel beta-helix repeat-containing protein n=1 Tax=Robertmurraya korlensis TaxID=519977 RepID=UPI00203B6D88|nr:right-handed parallel beta-helix repeat-containing protein [Robertmurraya korlensis]